MSFILKALKKSQLERELQSPETPPVRLEFDAEPSEKRVWWPWALAPVVLANLALAGYLLWPAPEVEVARLAGPTPGLAEAPKLPEPPQPAVTPAPAMVTPAPAPPPPAEPSPQLQTAPASAAAPLQAEAAPAPPSVASSPSGGASAPDRVAALPLPEPSTPSQPLAEPPSPNLVVSSPVSETARPVDPGGDLGPAPDAVRAAAPKENPRESPGGKLEENLAAQQVADSPPALLPRRKPASPPSPAPDPVAPPAREPQVVEELPRKAVPIDRPAMAAVGGTPPLDPKEPESAPTKRTRLTITPRVPSLRELPRAFRESLPEVRITIHVYDPDPRARMVRINRRKLREGQRTKNGIQIDEITPTGLIVTYKNTQFRMPIQ